MSEAMDSRIVQMVFENGQFEKNIHETIESLKELQKNLEFQDVGKQIDNLGDKLESTEKKVRSGLAATSVIDLTIYKIKNNIADLFINGGKQALKFSKDMASTLTTLDQINAGFTKYEDKTKAVQAIQSALPDTDFSIINDALDELNWYSDMTSYSFTNMVDSLGKFTAAGVDLETAVYAIEGINNEAAKSGATIAQANQAMYNFAQALSQGEVKLIDWKSIENANMATKEFKEQIIDTAVAMGTLRQSGDKIFTKRGSVVSWENMSSTLSQGWFTSDVLMEVLNRYSDLDTEFGQAAFEAARVSRTFSDAWLAIKDATSTGWMKSYELIFGNLEEASELWTRWGDAVIDATDGITSWRNEILQGWRDLGGREMLIEGLENTFSSLWNILVEVKNAFADVFPVDFPTVLATISAGVQQFGEVMARTFGYEKVLVETTEKGIAKGSHLLQAFSGALQIGDKGEEVKKLQKALNDLGAELDVDGVFGKKTEAALIEFQDTLKKTNDEAIILSKRDFGVNETSGEVVELQKKMVALGLLTRGTFAEGIYDYNTQHAFDQYKNSVAYLTDYEYKMGEKSEDVLALQEELIAAGYLADESQADGIYGPKTEAALKAYRKDAISTVDGVYDEATHKSLMEALDSKEGIESYADKTAYVWEERLGVGLQTVRTVVTGLLSVLSIVFKVLGGIFKVGMGILGYALRLLNPVLSLIVRIVTAISDALTIGSDMISDGTLFAGIIAGISGAFDWLSQKIEGAVKAVSRFLGFEGEVDEEGNEIYTLKKMWEDFMATLNATGALDALKSAWETLKATFEDIKTKISDIFADEETGKQAWEAVKTVLTTIATILGGIVAVIAMGLGELIKWVTPFVAKIPDAISKATTWITDIWNSLGLGEKISAKINEIGNLGEKIFTFLFGKDVDDGPGENGEKLSHHVEGFFEKAWKWINDNENIQNFLTNAKSVLESVVDFIFGRKVEIGEDREGHKVYTRVDGLFSKIRKWWDESKFIQKLFTNEDSVLNKVLDFFFGKKVEIGEDREGNKVYTRIGGLISKVKKWWDESQFIQKLFTNEDSVLNRVINFFFGKKVEIGEDRDGNKVYKRIGGLFSKIHKWWSESKLVKKLFTDKDSLMHRIKVWLIGERDEKTGELKSTGVLQDTWSWIKSTITKISDKVKEIWDNVTNFFSENFNLSKLSGGIGTGFSAVGNFLLNAFAYLGTWLSQLFASASDIIMPILAKLMPIIDSISVFLLSLGIYKIGKAASNLAKGFKWQQMAESFEKINDLFDTVTKLFIAMAATTFIISKMSPEEYSQAMRGIFLILVNIAAFFYAIVQITKMGINTEQLKGFGGLMTGIGVAMIAIALAMTVLSKMPLGDYLNGLFKMAGVLVVLSKFLKGVAKAGGTSDIKNIEKMSIMFGALVLGVMILGKLKLKTLAQGVIAVWLVTKILKGVVKSLGKYKPDGDASKSIRALVGMFLAMAVMTAVLGTLNIGQLAQGLYAVHYIVKQMRKLIKTFKKLKGVDAASIKNVMYPIAAIAGVIVALGFAISLTRGISAGQIAVFALPLFVACSAAKKVAKQAKSIKDTDAKSILNMAAPIIAIAAIAVGLGYALSLVKDVSAGQIAAFAVPLLVACIGARLAIGALKKMGNISAGKILSLALPLIAVAGLIVALGYAMSLAKDVSSSQMDGFANALLTLSPLLISLGLFMKLVGSLGWGGMAVALVGLVGVLAIVVGAVAAIGALADDNKFKKALSKGLGDIGTMIGTFLGNMKAAEFKALSNGLRDLSDVPEVDESAVSGALSVAQLLVDFENGLPAKDPLTKIIDWIGNSPLEQLGEDMTAFATGFNSFATQLRAVDELNDDALDEKTKSAIKIAGYLSDFEAGLPETTITDAIFDLIGLGSPIERFSTGMAAFGTAFNAFATEMSQVPTDLTDLETETTSAVAIATQIQSLNDGVKNIAMEAVGGILAKFGVETGISKLATDMDKFGGGFKTFAETMADVPTDLGDLEAKVTSAVSIASSIQSLNTGMSGIAMAKDVIDGVLGHFGIDTGISKLATDMDKFGGGFKTFAETMADVPTDLSDLGKKTETAVSIASSIQSLNTGMTGIDITKDVIDGITLKLGIQTGIARLSSDLGLFGAGFSAFNLAMTGVPTDTTDLETKAASAVAIAKSILTVSDGIKEESITQQVLDNIIGSPLARFSGDLGTFATGINAFAEEISKVDAYGDEEFQKKVDTVVGVGEALAGISTTVTGDGDTFWNNMLTWFGKKSKFAEFSEDIGTFGQSVTKFVTDLGANVSISDEMKAKAEAAVGIAQVVVDFLGVLQGSNLETDKNFVSRFFSGDTNVNTFFTKIGEFAQNIQTLGTSLAGFSDSGVQENWTAAKTMIDEFYAFVQSLAWDENGNSMPSLDVDNFDTLMWQLGEMNKKIEDFYKKSTWNGRDSNSFANTVNGLADLVDAVSNMNTSPISTSVISSDTTALIETNVTTMLDRVVGKVDSYYSRMYQAGANLVTGLANGIKNNKGKGTSAGSSLASEILRVIQEGLKEHSPSKATEQMGQYLDEGLAKGITGGEEDLKKEALSTVGGLMAKLSALLTEDIDTTPVIRPVLDLSDVTSNIGLLDGYFSDRNLNVRTSMQRASAARTSGTPAVPQTSSGTGSQAVAAITDLKAEVVALRAELGKMQVVMDGGALVGQIGPKMDGYLGHRAALERRRGG